LEALWKVPISSLHASSATCLAHFSKRSELSYSSHLLSLLVIPGDWVSLASASSPERSYHGSMASLPQVTAWFGAKRESSSLWECLRQWSERWSHLRSTEPVGKFVLRLKWPASEPCSLVFLVTCH